MFPPQEYCEDCGCSLPLRTVRVDADEYLAPTHDMPVIFCDNCASSYSVDVKIPSGEVVFTRISA